MSCSIKWICHHVSKLFLLKLHVLHELKEKGSSWKLVVVQSYSFNKSYWEHNGEFNEFCRIWDFLVSLWGFFWGLVSLSISSSSPANADTVYWRIFSLLARHLLRTYILVRFISITCQCWQCLLTHCILIRFNSITCQCWQCLLTHCILVRFISITCQCWQCLLTHCILVRFNSITC